MRIILVLGILIYAAACGVKGRPQPPLYAPPMGRGKPTLNGNSQGLKLNPLLSPSGSPSGESP
jgi:predicted small lipoprotein YifL